MTEFETATIAFQQTTLALQQGQLWAAIAIPAVSGLVGIAQCALIWMGLRRMDQANRARLVEAETRRAEAEARRAETAAWTAREDARAAREDARHAEGMTALRAVIQGLERQGAALEAALKDRAWRPAPERETNP